MPSHREPSTPFKPGPAARALAARVLLEYLADVSEQLRKVRQAEQIEPVHRIRVASRRFRNAVRIFSRFLPVQRKKWRKSLRRMARSLGAVRDTDVQILAVRKYLRQLSQKRHASDRPGVQRLLLRLTQHRRELQETAVKAIDKLESGGVLESIRTKLRSLKRGGTPRAARKDEALRLYARRTLVEKLEQMLAYERFLRDPRRVTELHRMRIAAKHLRYSLEAYGPLLGKKNVRAWIKPVKQVQTRLGEIHDADVWIAFLPQFVQQERRHREFLGHPRRFAPISRDLAAMIEDWQTRRRDMHGRWIRQWDDWAAMKLWARMRVAVCDF